MAKFNTWKQIPGLHLLAKFHLDQFIFLPWGAKILSKYCNFDNCEIRERGARVTHDILTFPNFTTIGLYYDK